MIRLGHGVPSALVLLASIALFVGCKGDSESKKKVRVKPELLLVAPVAGSINGGSLVALLTRGFADDFTMDPPQVTFGGAQATIDQIVNPEELWVFIPAGAALGPVAVTVISTGKSQSASCTACFQYVAAPPDPVITGLIPGQGDVAGGDTVVITGTDIEPSASVFFGSDATQWTPAPRTIFLDSNTLEVETPAEPNGQPLLVDVKVEIPGRGRLSFSGRFSTSSPRAA